MLLIKNGRVIDPARKKERNADIVVKDGKIEKIYAEGTLPAEAEAAANQVLDAKGLVVAPGLVDVHVHFRDPGLTTKRISTQEQQLLQKAVLLPLCVWQIQSQS